MKASVFAGTSLDGYIARRDGALDFLPEGGEPHGFEEFYATIDAMLIGRNTYDVVLGFGDWPYGEMPVFVLSSRPLAPAPPGAVVERLEGPPVDIAAQLAARGFGHIYVDGGITVTAFLEAGLVDRLIVTRVPVLIGRGIPLFAALSRDIALHHVATRTYASGLVQSEYLVATSGQLPPLTSEALQATPPIHVAGKCGQVLDRLT